LRIWVIVKGVRGMMVPLKGVLVGFDEEVRKGRMNLVGVAKSARKVLLSREEPPGRLYLRC